ncbi:hypothetical protein [Streptomyces sp. NPDC001985]|uniref:hypothetical protein n=1 Tax=Streptomyces sp. NPDC001985 TaxID=3154406 RepID=UPI00332B3E72
MIECTEERSGWADVLFTLAKVHLARAESEDAIPLYRQASDLYCEQEDRPNEEKVRRLFAGVLVSFDRSKAVAELERVMVLRELMGSDELSEVQDLLDELR